MLEKDNSGYHEINYTKYFLKIFRVTKSQQIRERKDTQLDFGKLSNC